MYCLLIKSKLSFINSNCSALSGFNLFLFSQYISPADKNTSSNGTEVGREDKYFRASLESLG